jgi:4'-phosphopantetheinyl transferase
MSAGSGVHVACGEAAALLALAPPAGQWLSPTEMERLAPMRSARRRASFLAARWQARWLLAQAFGGGPDDWCLDAPHDAAPRVLQRPDLILSISHSGDFVASALAPRPVGLDLEQPRPGRDIPGLVALCCTRSERALFDVLPPEEREAWFHELWTVKEAWLKRRGEWLAPSRLQQIEAAPAATGEIRTWRGAGFHVALCVDEAQQLRWWSPEPARSRRWSVVADRGPTPA